MAYDNNRNYDEKRNAESVFSKKIKAGKRRTYFFDVRETRVNDYFITLTESKKRFNDDGYDRHKMFLYKEDFNKFLVALTETIDHVKTELMPDFDFDAFNHDQNNENGEYQSTEGSNSYTQNTNTYESNNVTASVEDATSNIDTSMDDWKI